MKFNFYFPSFGTLFLVILIVWATAFVSTAISFFCFSYKKFTFWTVQGCFSKGFSSCLQHQFQFLFHWTRVCAEWWESKRCRGWRRCSGWVPGAEHPWGAGYREHDGDLWICHLQCWSFYRAALQGAAGSRWSESSTRIFSYFLNSIPHCFILPCL